MTPTYCVFLLSYWLLLRYKEHLEADLWPVNSYVKRVGRFEGGRVTKHVVPDTRRAG